VGRARGTDGRSDVHGQGRVPRADGRGRLRHGGTAKN
jgi:hypothetical protein